MSEPRGGWLFGLPSLFGYGAAPWQFYFDTAMMVLLAYMAACIVTGKKFW